MCLYSRSVSILLQHELEDNVIKSDTVVELITTGFEVYFKSLLSSFSYRQAWALVSVVGGGNGSCSEDVREHENHDTGGKALARREFVTVDGVRFFVSAYSEWWIGML